MALHGLDFDRADRRDVCDRRPGHAAEDDGGGNIDVPEATGQPADHSFGKVEQLFCNPATFHQHSDQNEQRHGDQQERVHGREHALRQQIDRC
ncbi:hypothetical protein D3C80_1723570 [compost metagenome]